MDAPKGSSDGEDIPSDFFDDFAKEDFIEGLSVIDSWDDSEKKPKSSRINAEKIDSVRDLRELIEGESTETKKSIKPQSSKYKWYKTEQETLNKKLADSKRILTGDNLNEYIKPGSRRDPNKTNEAIKKDKLLKVKEHLAKHLDSSDDLRPPGTELDDFFENHKNVEKEISKFISEVKYKSPSNQQETTDKGLLTKKSSARHRESPPRRHESPPRHRESPPRRRKSRSVHRMSSLRRQGDPRRSSPRRRQSPSRRQIRWSPSRRPLRSPRRNSPHRHIRPFHRFSPRSPEYRRERSRSPYRYVKQRSRSRSPYQKPHVDDFLYPKEYSSPNKYIKNEAYQMDLQYTAPMPMECAQDYTFPQTGYTGPGYSAPAGYNYINQPVAPVMPAPQPVPAPVMTSTMPLPVNPVPAPAMVPPPQQSSLAVGIRPTQPQFLSSAPVAPDALAKLVADGKLSHEDYLKLAPNKGVSQKMDAHARVGVLNRCTAAMSKLGVLTPPNRLLINNNLIHTEIKTLVPKFCSPLKRQASVDFHFTRSSATAIHIQNKHIIDTLISTLNLETVISRPKKKVQKNMKDASVQTVKPFCDMCQIRETTDYIEASTSIDLEHFSETVHTQVDEKDLINSKAVFNPNGGVGDGGPISIAHMTPAQLVNQLAARAKTLKQSEPSPTNQYNNPYEYDGRRDPGYRNTYNYRY